MTSEQFGQSPVLATRYAKKAARMIHSIEKSLIIVAAVVSVLGIVAVLDTLQVMDIIHVIDDNSTDLLATVFSLFSIATLFFALQLLIKSKRILNNWAGAFEESSLRTSIEMFLDSINAERALRAVAESVEEVGEHLENYISKGSIQELLNVRAGNATFDVLVDSDTVKGDSALSDVLKEYGAVVMMIIDRKAEKEDLVSFSASLKEYSRQKGDRDSVGIALLISKEIPDELYKLANSLRKTGTNLILVEKPLDANTAS